MSDTDVELRPVDYVVDSFPAGKTDFSREILWAWPPITWMVQAAWM